MYKRRGNRSRVDPGESPNAGFLLTKGDVEIFHLVYNFRFLRCDHLSILTGRSPKRVHRRVFRLVERGYLISIRLPQQKHLYALAKAALPVLVEHGVDSELVNERVRTRELKELFLKHELMVIHVHIALALSRDGPLRLLDWREGRGLFDAVTVHDHLGSIVLPIRPDGLFVIADTRRTPGTNRLNFFLEADRSTMAQARLRDKMRAYWHYLEQGLHSKTLGLDNFRMVTVTLTKARAKNLCELAAAVLPERARKYFLFASLDDILLNNPGAVFDSIYISPRDGGQAVYPLVPALGSAALP